MIPPLAQNIELAWEAPEYRRVFERLGSFSTFVMFDKRGTGASDRSAAVPTMDERVDDTRVVMDEAGIDRAFLLGISEGGPLALLFAMTYPSRVEGLVLHSTFAVQYRSSPNHQPYGKAREHRDLWMARWGCEDTISLDLMGPTASEEYRRWHPRYERHSVGPAGLTELVAMIEQIDVDELLPDVSVPTLIVHRRGDRVVPIEEARRMAAVIPGALISEFDGVDHMSHLGDVDGWIDAVEKFTTGVVAARSAVTVSATEAQPCPRIRLLGGFDVVVNSAEVPFSAWGSRRARQLCKRLALACGAPIPRDSLIELLWPDDTDVDRLSARLSVELSRVRRVLGGGVIADRSSVRLDLRTVSVDLAEMRDLLTTGDLIAAVGLYRGDVLPEDAYEDWVAPARDDTRVRFAMAAHRCADQAVDRGDFDEVCVLAGRILATDPFDEPAHRRLILALAALSRFGDVESAYRRYIEQMAEIGITAAPIDRIMSPPLPHRI